MAYKKEKTKAKTFPNILKKDYYQRVTAQGGSKSFWKCNAITTQPGFTCSELTMGALEQGVEYVQG